MTRPAQAAGPTPGHTAAVHAIHALGLDLHRTLVSAGHGSNLITSPLSVGTVLAMAHAGSEGATLGELSRVLHLPGPRREAQESFRHLGMALRAATPPKGPVTLDVAQRIFGSRAVAFDKGFLNLMVMVHRSPLERLDFSTPDQAAQRINTWIASATHDRIRTLLDPSSLHAESRLVLVNALHFEAAWKEPFDPGSARPEPFHLPGGSKIEVPTLSRTVRCGLRDLDGFQAVSIPYAGERFHFVALVPKEVGGLPRIEASLTPDLLSSLSSLPGRDVEVHVPRLRLDPPTLPLDAALRSLGLRTAFNDPPGSANFRAMVGPREPSPWITSVAHKCFLRLDEAGTEAAAAAAAVIGVTALPQATTSPPVVVRMDRPFLFLVMDRVTGAAILLGRITRP